MSQPIDTLAIEIEANAANSVDGVRKLSRALTSLSKSISSVNGAGIGNVASNLNTMSNAFNGVGAGGQSAASGTKKYTNTLPAMVSHTDKAAHSAKSLAYYFGKFYANMFLVIRAFKAFGKTVTGTMDYMESFNFWDVAITSATGKTDEWQELGYEDATAYAEAFKKCLAEFNQKMTGFSTSTNGDISVSDNPNLGINLTDLTTFQAEIVSITSSLGLCTSVSEDTSKALSMLVADMSSLKNIDLDKVMTNFQSGLIGQSRALYKYGIDITNATLQTYAYQYGIDKAVSEMTQAEKMQLRMLAILDQSKVAWGDLANTLEQPANQFRVLKNGIKNLGVTIGKLLMPMVSAVLPYLNAMVNALQSFFTWTANILGIELNVENTGTGTSDIFEDIEDSADDAKGAVKKLKNSLRSFDELNVISTKDDAGSGSDSSVGGGVDLSQEINASLAEYEKAWEQAYANIESRTKELSEKMLKFFKPVTDAIEKFAKGEISLGELVGSITGFTITNLEDALIKGLDSVDWDAFGASVYGFITTIPWGEIFAKGIDLGEVIFKISPKIESGFMAKFVLDVLGKIYGLSDEEKNKVWEVFSAQQEALEEADKNKSLIDVFKSMKSTLSHGGGGKSLHGGAGMDFEVGVLLTFDVGKWNEKMEEISEWMDENIFSLFSLETWIEKGANIGIGLATKWNEFTEWWSNTGFYNWWNDEVTPWFNKEEWNFSGIKEGLSSAWDSAIEAIKQLWNMFANWLNEKLTIDIDTSSIIGQGISAILGTDTITLGSLPTFANGGVTSADIFAANENGVPELIGTIGRKSAIASGSEVTGIADAVYSTASEEMALIRQQNELLRAILEKPVLDNGDIFRATKTVYRQEANRLGAHGNPAAVWG